MVSRYTILVPSLELRIGPAPDSSLSTGIRRELTGKEKKGPLANCKSETTWWWSWLALVRELIHTLSSVISYGPVLLSSGVLCCAVVTLSTHTHLMDTQLNSTMCLISGTLRPTALPWLAVLANIKPPTMESCYWQAVTKSFGEQGLALFVWSASTKPLWSDLEPVDITSCWEGKLGVGSGSQLQLSGWPRNPTTRFRPVTLPVVTPEPILHRSRRV